MAIPTFFKAVDSGSDGSKGASIEDNQENAVLPEITSQMRVNGAIQLEKFYIQTDSDATLFIGLVNKGMFDARLLLSSGESEVRDKVPADRKRYVSREIITNTTTRVEISEDDADFFEVDDYISIGEYIVQVTAKTVEDSRTKLDFSPAIQSVNYTGSYVSNLIHKQFTAGTAEPFWVENIIQAGAPADESKNIVPLIIQS